MFNLKHQRGMAGSSIVLLIIIFIFVLLIFFKLFPIYMENMQLVNALEEVEEDHKVFSQMDSNIREIILDSLYSHDIALLSRDNIKKHVFIERDTSENTVELTVTYSREATFMGNVYFLVKFEEHVILH